jgi:alkyl hydroperoxide reductase subunit AhpF
MSMISERDAQKIRDLFAQKLTGDVTITYFTQHESVLIVPAMECDTCKETRELLEELATLSDHITVVVKDFVTDREEAQRMGIERIPAFTLQGKNKGTVRYIGIPAGYEFATLIEDLIDASMGQAEVAEETATALSQVEEDLHIQVFVTPT